MTESNNNEGNIDLDDSTSEAFRASVRALQSTLPPEATASIYAAELTEGTAVVALYLQVPVRNQGRAVGTLNALLGSALINSLMAYPNEVRQRDTWVAGRGAKA